MVVEERPARYFIASGCPIATTTRYRCFHLQEQLQHLGLHATVVEWFDEAKIAPEEALTYDVLILYRLGMCPPLAHLIDRAHALGKRVLFDTDDLVFEPEMTEWHRGVQLLSASDQALYLEGVRRYLAMLEASDAVLTATPLLAELAQRRGKTAFVHRNALGQEMMALGEHLYHERVQRTPKEQVVIGYGSGTPTHDVDFQEAVPALADVLVRFPNVELWLVGPLALPPVLASFGERVRRFPLTDWRGWFALASQMDIALAPLELHNPFCRAKSEIKFVEAGVLGVPIVASRIDAFVDAITEGKDGLLASNAAEWRQALALLIQQPELRRQIGEAARRTVLQRYSLTARAVDLAEVLPKLAKTTSDSIERERNQLLLSPVPLVINWLVPEPFPGAGGDTGIFRMIRYLAEFGHECHVYVVAFNVMNDYSTEQVRTYMQTHFGATQAHYYRWAGQVQDADCTFATFWRTVEELPALVNGGRQYYFVQDFEPYFYPVGTYSVLAENTYRAGLHCITLGPWLTKLLQERYHATADYFDFAVDTDIYWPRPVRRDPRPRVCFYARPSTPRRAYELGLEALQLVKQQLPEIEIVFYGSKELAPPPPFPVVNHGLVFQSELAELFSSCEVGVVFSLTNPSFVPLEMMACRCAVIDIASERVEGVLTHGYNAWLVEPTVAAVAEGILKLLQDQPLREQLVENAYRHIQHLSWEKSARQVETILLRGASSATDHHQDKHNEADRRFISVKKDRLLSFIPGQSPRPPALPLTKSSQTLVKEASRTARLRRGVKKILDTGARLVGLHLLWRVFKKRIFFALPLWVLGRKLMNQVDLKGGLQQRFVADAPYLCRLEFLLAKIPPSACLQFTLSEEHSPGKIVADGHLDPRKVSLNKPVVVEFPVQEGSSGRSYIFTLTPKGSGKYSLWRYWCKQDRETQLRREHRRLRGQLACALFYRGEEAIVPGRQPLPEWGMLMRYLPYVLRQVVTRRK